MHFSVPMLFFQKKKNSLLKSEALTSPSLREALIRFRLGGLSRHGLLYPSTSTLRTALLGTFTGKQQGCKAPQGSGRPYMSWMNSLAEPTCVNIPHLTILRKYLGRPQTSYKGGLVTQKNIPYLENCHDPSFTLKLVTTQKHTLKGFVKTSSQNWGKKLWILRH